MRLPIVEETELVAEESQLLLKGQISMRIKIHRSCWDSQPSKSRRAN